MARKPVTVSTVFDGCGRFVFTLTARGMTERPPRYHFGYWGLREDIKRAFRGAGRVRFGCGNTEFVRPGNLGNVVLDKTSIQIGCMKFAGKDFTVLRAWARRGKIRATRRP